MRQLELKTPLACSAETAWEAIQQRAVFEHVTHPLLKIMPRELQLLPERTQEGTYQIKLYLFGFLPLGGHTIRVVRVDPLQRDIYTEESSALIETWNHRLTVYADAAGRTIYSDALSLEAGRLTPVVWALAYGFYRYRQARWRTLARTLETRALQTEGA